MPDQGQIELKTAVQRLAYFNPDPSEMYSHQILDHLTIIALSSYGPHCVVDALQIHNYIKEMFKIEFAEAEIIGAAQRLHHVKEPRRPGRR